MPTIVNEFTQPGYLAHTGCGECCLAYVAQGHGHGVTPVQVSEWLSNKYGVGNVQGGTNADQLVEYLQAQGIGATLVDGGLHVNQIAFVTCEPNGTLAQTSIGHWIVITAFDGSTYTVQNPAGGNTQQIPAGELESIFNAAHARTGSQSVTFAAFEGAAPAPAPQPAPQPSNGPHMENFSVTVQVPVANVRKGPGISYELARQVHHGQVLACNAWQYGPPVLDPVAHADDRRWYGIDMAEGAGWIASAMVNGNAPNSTP